MRYFSVTVWDRRDSSDPGSWSMESSPVKTPAMDSYNAAMIVARKANPQVKLEGVVRPPGSSSVFFLDKDFDIVFQVDDTEELFGRAERPLAGLETWKVDTTRFKGRTLPPGEYEDPYEYREKDVTVRELSPSVFEEI